MSRITGLSELTIVIPTVSRPLFILRQHEYWRDTDARIVILDGASSPISVPSSLQSPNIQYIHTGTRFNERLATASQYANTKYCALLPDDEFFLVSGLRAAIRRLEEMQTSLVVSAEICISLSTNSVFWYVMLIATGSRFQLTQEPWQRDSTKIYHPTRPIKHNSP